MELLDLVDKGMPVLVFGLLIYIARIDSKIKDIVEDISQIKKSITWADTCNERHKEINRRLGILDHRQGLNGEESE
jgi:hypothetical protein